MLISKGHQPHTLTSYTRRATTSRVRLHVYIHAPTSSVHRVLIESANLDFHTLALPYTRPLLTRCTLHTPLVLRSSIHRPHGREYRFHSFIIAHRHTLAMFVFDIVTLPAYPNTFTRLSNKRLHTSFAHTQNLLLKENSKHDQGDSKSHLLEVGDIGQEAVIISRPRIARS